VLLEDRAAKSTFQWGVAVARTEQGESVSVMQILLDDGSSIFNYYLREGDSVVTVTYDPSTQMPDPQSGYDWEPTERFLRFWEQEQRDHRLRDSLINAWVSRYRSNTEIINNYMTGTMLTQNSINFGMIGSITEIPMVRY
jgi:hypothetical protein